MSYVQRVLQPGETVVHQSRLHPLIFLPALIWLLIALALLVASTQTTDDRINIALIAAAVLFGVLALASWARAAIRRATTELAITDRRVIYKSGLLSRHTLEMNRSKVESVDVDQSILGRIFDYGDVIVKGTGTGFEPLTTIAAPLDLRNHITGV
jgi:uncharacterized membrane protein YdbT with pleckstrin-like domain